MPGKKPAKPIYQRGQYRLYRRSDRTNLEIVWYDAEAGRDRSTTARTGDDAAGRKALDKLYLASEGQKFCECCGRPFDGDAAPLLLTAISDYLIRSEGKAGYKATSGRLAHVVAYVAETNPGITVPMLDPAWAGAFRKWLAARDVVTPVSGQARKRAIGGIEGIVRQLVAAINATPGQKAQFKAEQPKAVSASPGYRADVKMLAAMFRFCLDATGTDKERTQRLRERASLLAYLRAAVATWARPAEIFDLGQGQWNRAARVLNLNPPGRRQTRKYRTQVPVPAAFAPHLDKMGTTYMPATTVRAPWAKMRAAVGLPEGGEAGEKLIRRSMATIVRRRIGEAQWRQGEMMLGHVKLSISDIYAIPDPANLGLALDATEAVIAEIESLTPGAFTANAPQKGVGKMR